MTIKPLRILIIDDQQNVLDALQDALEEAGHQSLTANTGLMGLSLAEKQLPDLILLDYFMPDMDGLQVLQVLKQSPAMAGIPVILLTGAQDVSLMRQSFELGALDFLHKPCNVLELQARVAHYALLKEAQDTSKQWEDMNRSKEAFMSILSHEMRTPLTAIIGFSDLLRMGIAGPLNERQTELLNIIQNRAIDLQQLIERLLEFKLLQAGERKPDKKLLVLADLVNDAIDRIRSQVLEQELHWQIHLPDQEVQLQAEGKALIEILVVLLGNAVKFTPAGGTITVAATADSRQVTISISDTGIGIPQDKLPTIFEGFRQLEKYSTRKYPGLGIGLTIAKGLVEMHGGRIWAESREGEGSIFSILLPVGTKEIGLVPNCISL